MEDVTVRYRKETDALELYFEKPPRKQMLNCLKMEPHRFRWNPEASCWYGKRTTERESFIQTVLASAYRILDEREKKDISNRFADHYDVVGADKIYDASTVNIRDFIDRNQAYGGAYFKDSLTYVCVDKKDYVRIVMLENARKDKKTCPVYDLYFKNPQKEGVCRYLLEVCGIKTVFELLSLIKNPSALQDLSLDKRMYPSMRVFSPFCEIGPLKELPKEWTKKDLERALFTGQVYEGHVVFELSGDPDVDIETNAMRGKRIQLPDFCREIVSSYDKEMLIYSKPINERKAELKLVSNKSTYVLTVDLDSNIEYALRKESEFLAIREQKNQEQLKRVIPVMNNQIKKDAFYRIEYLIENEVTKILEEKKALIQGCMLYENALLKEQYEKTTAIAPAQILPDQLYQVSSMFHPVAFIRNDERLLLIGNQDVLVSGLGLLELSKDISFPYINERPFCGNSFEDAKVALAAFVEGQAYWGITNPEIDYKESLMRIEKEENRCKEYIKEKSTAVLNQDKHMENEQFKDLDALLLHITKMEAQRKQKKTTIRKPPSIER